MPPPPSPAAHALASLSRDEREAAVRRQAAGLEDSPEDQRSALMSLWGEDALVSDPQVHDHVLKGATRQGGAVTPSSLADHFEFTDTPGLQGGAYIQQAPPDPHQPTVFSSEEELARRQGLGATGVAIGGASAACSAMAELIARQEHIETQTLDDAVENYRQLLSDLTRMGRTTSMRPVKRQVYHPSP